MPPTPPSRHSRVDLSKKPELWEAYLGGGGCLAGGLGRESGKELGLGTNWKFEYLKDWESIKPICADQPASLSDSDPTSNSTSLTPPSTLARARMFLNPPMPTIPLPPSSDNGSNTQSTNISVTELSPNSPTTVRVTVLIAMPSPSSHGPSPSSSASLSSSLSSQPQLATSHPLQLSCPRPNATVDEPLPHLEMGVAQVIIGPSDNSST